MSLGEQVRTMETFIKDKEEEIARLHSDFEERIGYVDHLAQQELTRHQAQSAGVSALEKLLWHASLFMCHMQACSCAIFACAPERQRARREDRDAHHTREHPPDLLRSFRCNALRLQCCECGLWSKTTIGHSACVPCEVHLPTYR